MSKCGIYKITNLINNKCYIGQSTDIIGRWRHHKAASKNEMSNSYNYPLQRAFRKYGIENFSFEIIEECLKSQLDQRESYWINYYEALGDKGYNQVRVQQAGTKITPLQVWDIIDMLKNTEISTEELGKEFNVSGRAIRAINTGEAWYSDNIKYPIREKWTHQAHLCIDCGKPTSGKEYIRCSACANKARIIPLSDMIINRETLKNLIRTKPFTKIGEQYQVSDNAIRKWCIKFNLPSRKKDINSYSDEEWENI